MAQRGGDGRAGAVLVSPDAAPPTPAPPLPEPPPSAAAVLALETLRTGASHPIVNGFPQGAILVFDRELRYLCAGGRGLADVGLTREMMEGKTIFEVFDREFVDVIEPQYRSALQGVESSMDLTFAGRTYMQRLGPVHDADGKVIAGMGFTQEVTQARLAEAALRESQERVALAFAHAPIANALIGLDGRFEQVNQAMCEFTGYTAEQLLQLRSCDVTHPDDLAGDVAALEFARADGVRSTSTLDTRYVTATGTTVWGAQSVSLLRADDGAPLRYIVQIQDITERKEHDQVLARERRRVADAEAIGRSGSWQLDLFTGTLVWSEGMFKIYGIDPAGWPGTFEALGEVLTPADRDRIRAAVAASAASGESFRLRHHVRRGDGAVRWFESRGAPLPEGDGHTVIAGTLSDVTESVLAADELSAAHALQQAVISTSPDIIFVYDVASRRAEWSNRSLPELLGYPADSFTGPGVNATTTLMFDDADRAQFEATLTRAQAAADGVVVSLDYRLRHADGSPRWFSRRTIALQRDPQGTVTKMVGVLRDITEAMASEQRLQHSALHDHLTGLPNRALLLDRLTGAIARSHSERREVAILFCDLDSFKRVNDTAGHAAGDAVLVETARRLKGALREGDTVARVGGDEFVVIIEPWNRSVLASPAVAAKPEAHAGHGADRDRDHANQIAERIVSALRRPISHNGVEHVISASIGLTFTHPPAVGQPSSMTPEQVLQDSDAAMYRAKSLGKDRFAIFEPAMRADLVERGRVEHVLRQALRRAREADGSSDLAAPDGGLPGGGLSDAHDTDGGALFAPAYQPVFDLATGALVGFEALARLTDTAGLEIPPDVFIPIAEDTGLIRALGTLMLELACRQLADWRAETSTLGGLSMAVNVSALQAHDPTLGPDVRRVIAECALAPRDLILELTETALLEAAPATIAALQVLRDDGVGIAIDDFGTGYASLRYLATLPISSLKIDRSFTAGLPDDKTSAKIVYAVAGLAADLGLACVVEGVETETQRAALPAGVQVQGWLTGRPQRAELLDPARLADIGATGAVAATR